MVEVRNYVHHKISRAEHQLLTGPLAPPRPAAELAKTLLGKGVSQIDRFGAAVQLASGLLQRIGVENPEGAVQNLLIQTRNAPFKNTGLRLLTYGWENYVFLLEGKKPSVLKTDIHSAELPTRDLMEKAKTLRSTHQTIKKWFEGVEGFIIPSEIIIGNMPFRNRPAVGIIQPYVENARDLFDFSDEELLTLFARNPSLNRQFSAVAGRIESVFNQTESSIDLNGKGNLVITAGNKPQIMLLDNCSIVNVDNLRETNQTERLQNHLDRINRLRDLNRKLEEQETPVAARPVTIAS